jgi:hypothetical protein
MQGYLKYGATFNVSLLAPTVVKLIANQVEGSEF